jgi:DNA primase
MDAKDEIKNRLSIEDVIGEYVQLKRAGRSWKGLSPFNPEKTPSFVVSPDKQIWHDFSSGKGGDMFSFVMEMEGLDFRGALELLARRAGIDLEQYKQTGHQGPSGKTKERLYGALELATKFYQTQFSQNKAALHYALKTRAFTKETAVEWRLGYSPNTGTALVDFLQSKGFTADEIKLAGLSSQNYRGLGDMFRGRLMIPLCDPSGRVIGFTARLLVDDPKAPKYINTPATPLYDKSRHVFGLHLAKDAIRKSKFVVLAEGQLDVITSHQAGVRQVGATAGTALTEPHLKALSRLTGDIRLSFDADRAGIAATERAIPIAAKVGVQLSIITIPSGKDPDELIRRDVKVWQEIITKPQYAVDWLIERYVQQLDLGTAQGKKELSDVVLRVVRQLPDSVEQDHYIGKLAELLSVNKQALDDKLSSVESETQAVLRRATEFAPEPIDKTAVERQRNEEGLLAITFLHPKLRSYLYPLTTDMFSYEPVRRAFVFLQEHPDYDGTDKEMLQEFAEYVKMLSFIYDEDYGSLDSVGLENQVIFLRKAVVEDYVKIQKSKNKASMDSEDYSEGLKRDSQLNELLKITKGGSK